MRRHQRRICHRRLANRAADGADVAALGAEGADHFGEVFETDLAGVGQGDGGAQRLLKLADVEGANDSGTGRGRRRGVA